MQPVESIAIRLWVEILGFGVKGGTLEAAQCVYLYEAATVG